MSDDQAPPEREPEALTPKERLKQRRRDQYRQAKEAYKASDQFKAAKQRQKDYRKEQYEKAKKQKKSPSDGVGADASERHLPTKERSEPANHSQPKLDLLDKVQATATHWPKLRLVKNADQEGN